MSKHIRLVLTIALLSTVPSSPLKAYASPFELAYDDGDFDYAWSDFYPNGAGVRFTPPALPWRITSVLLYGLALERGGNMLFTLEVRDQFFGLVYVTQYATLQFFENGTFSWARIPLPNITLNSEFYVCIYPCFSLDATQLWIGVDEDPPISNRSLLVDRENDRIVKAWDIGSGRPRNFMIRVEVEGEAKHLMVDAPGVLKGFDVENIVFKRPKGDIVNLVVAFKSGDAIGFRLSLGEDGKSVKITPMVARGEGNYDEILSLEYKSEVGLRSC